MTVEHYLLRTPRRHRCLIHLCACVCVCGIPSIHLYIIDVMCDDDELRRCFLSVQCRGSIRHSLVYFSFVRCLTGRCSIALWYCCWAFFFNSSVLCLHLLNYIRFVSDTDCSLVPFICMYTNNNWKKNFCFSLKRTFCCCCFVFVPRLWEKLHTIIGRVYKCYVRPKNCLATREN